MTKEGLARRAKARKGGIMAQGQVPDWNSRYACNVTQCKK